MSSGGNFTFVGPATYGAGGGGGAVTAATGTVQLDDTSAPGALVIPLTQAITPSIAIFSGFGSVADFTDSSARYAHVTNLPATSPGNLQVLDQSQARVIEVQILSYGLGQINCQIASNGFNPGDIGIISVAAFV